MSAELAYHLLQSPDVRSLMLDQRFISARVCEWKWRTPNGMHHFDDISLSARTHTTA